MTLSHYLSPSGLSFASASRLFLASMQAAEEFKPLVNQRHYTFLKQPGLPSHCPSSFSSGRKTPAYDIHGTEQGQPLSTESTNDPQRPKWISIDVNYTYDKYGREKYVQKMYMLELQLSCASSSLASFSLASCASFASLALASSSIMALPSIAPGMAPMGIVGTIGMAPKPILRAAPAPTNSKTTNCLEPCLWKICFQVFFPIKKLYHPLQVHHHPDHHPPSITILYLCRTTGLHTCRAAGPSVDLPWALLKLASVAPQESHMGLKTGLQNCLFI